MPILQIEIPKKANAKVVTKDLDMTDKLREVAVVHIASYQQRMTNPYNKHVNPCAFRAGDLVLRRVLENTVDPTVDKF